jgi:hypothetical protein
VALVKLPVANLKAVRVVQHVRQVCLARARARAHVGGRARKEVWMGRHKPLARVCSVTIRRCMHHAHHAVLLPCAAAAATHTPPGDSKASGCACMGARV